MKFTYPAIFKKNKEGGYDGRFVDLACCEVSGYSLDAAIRNAIEAEGDWIRLEMEEDIPTFPPVSDLEDLELREGEIARNIGVTVRFYDGWDE